jgi:hypothetical protein
MNANEFVALWHRESDTLVACFLSESEVASRIETLKLSGDQLSTVHEIVKTVVRDTMYTLLLGLDGAASIGGTQQDYIIHDESGSKISGPGDLEAAAYEQFQAGNEK